MKKIFKIRFIFLLLALTMQFSCSNYLELLPPNGLIREKFWKTKEDVESVLMGAYQSFATMNGSLFTYGEARGDMVTAHSYFQWSDDYKLMQSNINPQNGFCNWSSFYKVIDYCNEVIKNAPEVQKIDNTFNDFQLKGFLAEAHFLRSLSYFYLVRIFKDVPLVLEPSSTDAVDFYLPQTKGEDVLAAMVKYLDENRPYATIDGYKTVAENKGRATRGAYDALLADISLWLFDYENCIKYCDRILPETNPESKYLLMPSDKWFELYSPGNSLESIFEFQFKSFSGPTSSLQDMTNNYSYKYLPSQVAIEKFAFKYASEKKRGEEKSIAPFSGEDNYMIWKYVGMVPGGQIPRVGSEANRCDWIVYRLADVYLMKAEALSQVNRFDEAADILNKKIRTRADVGALVLANSPIAFEDAIMDERALELAFEGKRWFDLLRMGRRNNYSRKAKLVDLIIKNVSSTQKRILAAKLTNSLGWYLPVSKDEINRNKNLVQNPYYIF